MCHKLYSFICFCSIPKQNQISPSIRMQNTWSLLISTLSQIIVAGTATEMWGKLHLKWQNCSYGAAVPYLVWMVN